VNVVTTSLGAEARNVREARRFVLHAHSAVELSLTLDADRVRVEVRDDGDGEPARRELVVEATSGRGLALVDMLATDWGVVGHGLGKSVWFELLR